MIDNYYINGQGVLVQKERNNFVYDATYVDYYNKIRNNSVTMSALRLGHLFGVLERHISIKSILDVGYGNGDFLNIAKTMIDNCYGYDITGIDTPLDCERIDSLDYSVHYDVVTFFDSLEHFDDINWISNINCDYIVISVPYCHYLDTMDDKDLINWKHLKPNEHLYHFNIKSLISHFSVNGYEPISMSNIEDSIRKSSDGRQNIITGVFCKM